MLGLPVSSALQSAVKQVAISSGQILVAKGNPSSSKGMGGKQAVAQGVAKALVSGSGSAAGPQASTKTTGGSGSGKSGGQRSSGVHKPGMVFILRSRSTGFVDLSYCATSRVSSVGLGTVAARVWTPSQTGWIPMSTSHLYALTPNCSLMKCISKHVGCFEVYAPLADYKQVNAFTQSNITRAACNRFIS